MSGSGGIRVVRVPQDPEEVRLDNHCRRERHTPIRVKMTATGKVLRRELRALG
jgi:hypothetical protein